MALKTPKTIKDLFKIIEEESIKHVDFRFTDPRGKLQHTAQHVSSLDEALFNDGIMFDGSSIAGWQEIHQSDMILMPDISTATLDPFTAQPTMNIFCDVFDPDTQKPYGRDPRSIAKAAVDYLSTTGIADTAYFGPEAEFFIFDDVKIRIGMSEVSYKISSEESPFKAGDDFEGGNMGHRPGVKGGYFPVQPVDALNDIRAEMVEILDEIGVEVEKHHHEVAPSQCELGIKYADLVKSADNIQHYKYVVHNTAHLFGKTATFLPKPVYGDNGSGMHVHISLWNGKKPLFAGNEYEGLSEDALYYIGGIIKHAKALNAFTNASTNSYKRLVPGYEAPVLLAYSGRNRSAACRIPYSVGEHAKRIEIRFPDPTANPYLAFAAMLMAGLDGIKNKIHPGDASDKNLYDLPADELAKIPTVAGSLREALNELRKNHEFLTQGGVFTKDMIDGYIDLKMEEVKAYEMMPHPIEFEMYYST